MIIETILTAVQTSIFAHPNYRSSMSDLTKLVVFSSAIHQTVFSTISTLWFSIGQVQDAGLIFLSQMASHIAQETESLEEALSTAVVLLGLATALLGAVVVLVGKFKVSPACVVSGFSCLCVLEYITIIFETIIHDRSQRVARK
jgi:hydrogenase maturation factor